MDEKNNLQPYEYDEELLYSEAVKYVRECGKATVSVLQRRFKLGYARAARLLDRMEIEGVVTSLNGSQPRSVIGFEMVDDKNNRSVSSIPVSKKPVSKSNITTQRKTVKKKPVVKKKHWSFDWDWFFNPSYCCPNCGSPAFKYVMRSAGRKGTVRRYRHPVKRSWFWSSGRSEINIMSRQKTVGYCPDCGYMTEHRRHSPFSICLVILCIIIFIVIAFQKGWIYVY